MTDAKLNALVAEKVMGWRRIRTNLVTNLGGFHSTGWYAAETPNPDPGGSWSGIDPKDQPRAIAELRGWKPSTDIVSAWRVVEKMHAEDRGFDLELSRSEIAGGEQMMWRASFSPCYTLCGATTATRAICLAALAAIDGDA